MNCGINEADMSDLLLIDENLSLESQKSLSFGQAVQYPSSKKNGRSGPAVSVKLI